MEKNNSRKLMLVAESNYLPPKSTISKNSENCYTSTQSDLTNEEIAWVNRRNILKRNWKLAGHMVFKDQHQKLEVQ
jgi:hypothetical protein